LREAQFGRGATDRARVRIGRHSGACAKRSPKASTGLGPVRSQLRDLEDDVVVGHGARDAVATVGEAGLDAVRGGVRERDRELARGGLTGTGAI